MSKKESNRAKGLAIIMMFILHLLSSADEWKEHEIRLIFLSQERVMDFAVTMKICVAVFVFITAYGICRSLKSKVDSGKITMNQYIVSRIFSLYSGFWFVYILARLTGFLGRNASEIYGEFGVRRAFYVIVDMLGLARFFGTPTFCSTWWYMSLALVLIFIIPFMREIYKKYGSLVLVGIVLLFPTALGLGENDQVKVYYRLSMIEKSTNIEVHDAYYDFMLSVLQEYYTTLYLCELSIAYKIAYASSNGGNSQEIVTYKNHLNNLYEQLL